MTMLKLPNVNATEFSNIRNGGVPQKERLKRLIPIAIEQMKLLVADHGIENLRTKNNGFAS